MGLVKYINGLFKIPTYEGTRKFIVARDTYGKRELFDKFDDALRRAIRLAKKGGYREMYFSQDGSVMAGDPGEVVENYPTAGRIYKHDDGSAIYLYEGVIVSKS